MDWFMEKAVKASFWMVGIWLGFLGLAAIDAAAERGNRAMHEYLCEAPNVVVIVYSHDAKGYLQRKRECKPRPANIIKWADE